MGKYLGFIVCVSLWQSREVFRDPRATQGCNLRGDYFKLWISRVHRPLQAWVRRSWNPFLSLRSQAFEARTEWWRWSLAFGCTLERYRLGCRRCGPRCLLWHLWLLDPLDSRGWVLHLERGSSLWVGWMCVSMEATWMKSPRRWGGSSWLMAAQKKKTAWTGLIAADSIQSLTPNQALRWCSAHHTSIPEDETLGLRSLWSPDPQPALSPHQEMCC